MRGNEFLDKMELIDPAYVEAADAVPKKNKRTRAGWGTMAACLCLIAAAAIAVPKLLSGNGPTPVDSDPLPAYEPNVYSTPYSAPESAADKPREVCELHYNEASAVVDAARKYIPGYFTEELSGGELAAVMPDRQAPDMTFSGYAGFDGEGALIDVVLQTDAPFLNGANVTVFFSYNEPFVRYAVPDEPAVSKLNGHDFEIYQWSPDGNTLYYDAFGEVNGCSVRISYKSNGISAAQARANFEVIADCFTDCKDGKPDLSAIKADVIPEFFDLKLTLSEAQADADFGDYMPGAVPPGYAEESIRRYRDWKNDYLYCLWTNGYDELSWQISCYTEQDANRLTGINETENYDLSLYPIPRAQSVPDGLREIVDDPIFIAEELTPDTVYARAYRAGESGDSSGWRMTFSVKYGNIIVRVSSKGVEPEWIYRQLTDLLKK